MYVSFIDLKMRFLCLHYSRFGQDAKEEFDSQKDELRIKGARSYWAFLQ